MLELSNISMSYEDDEKRETVLSGVSFSVPDGKCVVLTGASGSGKTTLLRIAAGLKRPQSGERRLDGRVVEGLLPDMNFMFQDYGLFPWKTVRENILLPYRVKKRQADPERYRQVLKLLEISSLEKAYPDRLSGGQRQRTALGRILMGDENILLLDEPFSALDVRMRTRLTGPLRERTKRSRASLIVTHSMREALLLGDRIVFLSESRKGVLDIFENTHIDENGYEDSATFRGNLRDFQHKIINDSCEAMER